MAMRDASLARLLSDKVLNSAYEWLCRAWRDYPASADIWNFRRNGRTKEISSSKRLRRTAFGSACWIASSSRTAAKSTYGRHATRWC
jgi:hypothetical protein